MAPAPWRVLWVVRGQSPECANRGVLALRFGRSGPGGCNGGWVCQGHTGHSTEPGQSVVARPDCIGLIRRA